MYLPRRERRKIIRRTETARKKGRMKYIRFKNDFTTPSGQPIYIPNPDVEKQRINAEDAFKERQQAVKEGRDPIGVIALRVKADFKTALTWFLDNIPHAIETGSETKENPRGRARKVTISDGGNAYAVIMAMQNVKNNTLELEDMVYDWLVETVKIDGIAAFSAPVAGALMARIKDTVIPPGKNGKESEADLPIEAAVQK